MEWCELGYETGGQCMDEVVERSGKGYWLFFVCVFVFVYMLVRGRMRNSDIL